MWVFFCFISPVFLIFQEDYRMEQPQLIPGKLYKFDGHRLVELEPSHGQKLPVTKEAYEYVKQIQKATQERIGARPDISIVASALILGAAQSGDSVEQIRAYGRRIYGD
jgi:hypothetical protein